MDVWTKESGLSGSDQSWMDVARATGAETSAGKGECNLPTQCLGLNDFSMVRSGMKEPGFSRPQFGGVSGIRAECSKSLFSVFGA